MAVILICSHVKKKSKLSPAFLFNVGHSMMDKIKMVEQQGDPSSDLLPQDCEKLDLGLNAPRIPLKLRAHFFSPIYHPRLWF